MQIIRYPEKSSWDEVLARPVMDFKSISHKVKPIMKKVRNKGDKALIKLAARYDNTIIDQVWVSEQEIEQAEQQVPQALKDAMHTAFKNLKLFHEQQKEHFDVVETMPGVKCWRKSIAIRKVGLYIPGGTAPLFSTVLMLGVPAMIAGCSEVIICTPPDKQGQVHPAILYAASLTGISRIVKAGGAQAIAALAYGTESIPKVDKIFGPGNQYVTAAKQLVGRQGVAIDMPAGPSEVAILADNTSNPAFIAADLLSQAEHGIDSQVVLVSTSETLIEKVQAELAHQLEALPRKAIAAGAIAHSRFILVDSTETGVELLNEYAAEHLILATENPEHLAEKIYNAGSVFLGHYTPEAAGDYASGTNHTLPTNGFAKAWAGVSLDSFVKKITYQHISPEGLKNLGPAVEIMAEAEMLHAHKEAVSVRLRTLN
jgi:histidinol dehydrogenase